MSSKAVFGLIALMFVLMCVLYVHLTGLVWPAILAAVVLIVRRVFLCHHFREAWSASSGSSQE